MSRTRYEPVPQRDETIILDSIHGSPHYNYNSGLANSVASSRYEPSINSTGGGPPAPPSIPNSPPPSFHTHSSPGTPRPTPSTTTHASQHSHSHPHHESAPSYVELWGVAPSTFGGDTTNTNTIGTSNDALATIAGLKQRIEWLEESIGRLLMEKDQNTSGINNHNSNSGSESENGEGDGSSKKERDNCCVIFTDVSPDLERALTSGKGTNCCVAFRSKSDASRKQRGPLLILLAILFMVCMTIVLVAEAGSKKPYSHDGGDRTLTP